MAPFKSGFVSLVGRPNVGKSTLMNRLMGTKLAIVSAKPQTTRSCLQGILTLPERGQIIFVDTPGIHKPQHLLGRHIVQQAMQMLQEVECNLFLVDGTDSPGAGDQFVARSIAQAKVPTFLLLNKLDKIPESKRTQHLAAYQALGNFAATFMISAKHGWEVDNLITALLERLPEGVALYGEDELTNQSEAVLSAELIREQVFRQTGDEIPHATSVVIEQFKDRTPDLTYIGAAIVVERDSQKAIVIGKQGTKLKEIGQAARKSLELFLGRKVFLELFVKVIPHWRNERRRLQQLGYELENK